MLKLLTIASLTLGLAACGGGNGGGGGGPAVTFQKGQPVKVKATEYAFDPGNITIEGGGGPTTIELENAGSLAHDLRVEKSSEDIGGTPIFTGGETKSAKVTLAPGEYEFLCSVGDHADRGMRGKLTVR
jgi:plastocyanin